MKKRFWLVAFVLLAVVIGLLFWRHGSGVRQVASEPASVTTTAAPGTNRQASLGAAPPRKPRVEPLIDEGPSARAVELAKRWMSAAKPFNYDPVVKRVIDKKHPRDGRVVEYEVVTSNFSVQVALRSDGEMVKAAMSAYDSDRTLPEHQAKWYQLTGTWTEREAVAEAYAVLQRLGEAQTISLITATNYEATPLPLQTPDGNTVTNIPFVNVTFSDARGVGIVNAQYRMEPSGPGLVRWWNWPPARK